MEVVIIARGLDYKGLHKLQWLGFSWFCRVIQNVLVKLAAVVTLPI